MSIGPSFTPPSQTEVAFEKVRIASARSVKALLEQPLHYVFWLSLIGLIVGLFAGMNPPAALYAIILCLGIARFTAFVYTNRSKTDHAGSS